MKFCGDFANHKSWEKRNDQEHRRRIREIRLKAASELEKYKLEIDKGVRFSELLRLYYFDIVRMHIVDPMHNLLLGTAKKMHVYWLDHKILTKAHLQKMQEEMKQFVVPNNIGRLPIKIAAGMMNFTANEWKNYTLIYSLILLKGKIPDEDLKCWRYFVQALSYLCNKSLDVKKLESIHETLLRFGETCEKLYGPQFITPNMHLHCHLIDCILDYGPMYVFWTFSMERMNGIMGSQPNNCKDIGEQVMKKLLQEMHVFGTNDDLSHDNFEGDTQGLQKYVAGLGSDRITAPLANALADKNLYCYEKFCTPTLSLEGIDWSFSNTDFLLSKHPKNIILENNLMNTYLKQMYEFLYPNCKIFCPNLALQFSKMEYGCKLFSAKTNGHITSSYVLAAWMGCEPNEIVDGMLKPCQIINLYKHSILVNDEAKQHLIAHVNWFRELPRLHNFFGPPIQVFSDYYYEPGKSSFVPLQRLHSTFACALTHLEGYKCMAVCPIARSTLW